ncbi:hypothetical protein CU098_005069, partial [Rhizopus stolonifer]
VGFLNDSQDEQDLANFQKVKAYYSACTNLDVINSNGPTPLYPYISKLLSSIDNSPDNKNNYFGPEYVSSLTDTLIELLQHGAENIIWLDVGITTYHPDRYTLSLSQVDLTLPYKENYNHPYIIEQFRDGLVSILTQVLGEDASNISSIRFQMMHESNLYALGPKYIESMVDRFIQFESRLANLTLSDDEFEDPVEMTLFDLDQKYPVVNWTQIAYHFLPENTKQSDKVSVTAPQYIERLTNWFLHSQENKVSVQTIREYFVIKLILTDIPQLDQTTQNIYDETIANITTGIETPLSREFTCVKEISAYFGHLLGRYYVMKSFGGEPQRKKIAQLVDSILTSWIKRLKENTWLDEETRDFAIKKASNIVTQLAYGIVDPDVRSSRSISSYYSSFSVNENDYFQNMLSVYNASYRLSWSHFGKEVYKNKWDDEIPPSDVNAFYRVLHNDITVPAGILQFPFFSSELPDYMNYGGIGIVIGHEISHAFDNNGRLYDSNGFLKSWWTNKSADVFVEKSQCFVHQYSNFSIEGTDNKTYYVNGDLTLGENLSDNGGVLAAYQALFSKDRKYTLLPGLEKFSAQQLFFINHAKLWCSKSTSGFAIRQIHTDTHSPNNVRVNAGMQNSPEFSEAFQCRTGQPMNPSKKCEIW